MTAFLRATVLPSLLLVSGALAQLQVQTPPTPTCLPGTQPVLGIAIPGLFDGAYGLQAREALAGGLQAAGFQVYPDFDDRVADKASILLDGRVETWHNSAGDETSRVGDVRLVVTDMSTGKRALTLTQKPAFIMFKAPKLGDFVASVVGELRGRYCQQEETAP